MFTKRTPVFQFQSNRRSSNSSPLQVIMPRKSSPISRFYSLLKGMEELPNEGLPHSQRGSVVDKWIARVQVRCMIKLMSICT